MKSVIKNKNTALANMVIAREVLGRHGIQMFLNFGTLLGALREKDFIPHDDDVDVGIFERDKPKFMALWGELSECGLVFLEKWENDLCYSFVRDGEQIDFFITREQRMLAGRGWDLDARVTVPARHLDTLEDLIFLGEVFKVPCDPYGFVRNLYGKNWNIPIEKCPSRIRWTVRLSKMLKAPGKTIFYAKRFVSTRLRWFSKANKARRKTTDSN